jgi:hypothetical protein
VSKKRTDTSRHRPVPAWTEQLAAKWDRKADDEARLAAERETFSVCANELREASQREGT